MAYTSSKAKAGRGTVVSIGGVTGAGGTETFTPIYELTNASFSGSAWGTEDTSNFNSGVDEEFIANMRNNGELNLEGNVVDTDPGQVLLTTAYNSGSKYDFKVQNLPGPGETTGTLRTLSGLVTSYDETVTVKGKVAFTVKVKISGAITVTPGA